MRKCNVKGEARERAQGADFETPMDSSQPPFSRPYWTTGGESRPMPSQRWNDAAQRDLGNLSNSGSSHSMEAPSLEASEDSSYSPSSSGRSLVFDYDHFRPPPQVPAARNRKLVPRSVSRVVDPRGSCSPEVIMIDVCPGIQVPLRGSEETWEAILNDYYMPGECSWCTTTVFAIQDCGYVLCPQCGVVFPVSDMIDRNASGVGLGFTFDDLARWQPEIDLNRQRQYVDNRDAQLARKR